MPCEIILYIEKYIEIYMKYEKYILHLYQKYTKKILI